jgi:hypothetical protein
VQEGGRACPEIEWLVCCNEIKPLFERHGRLVVPDEDDHWINLEVLSRVSHALQRNEWTRACAALLSSATSGWHRYVTATFLAG